MALLAFNRVWKRGRPIFVIANRRRRKALRRRLLLGVCRFNQRSDEAEARAHAEEGVDLRMNVL
jgi:hypothetical protein